MPQLKSLCIRLLAMTRSVKISQFGQTINIPVTVTGTGPAARTGRPWGGPGTGPARGSGDRDGLLGPDAGRAAPAGAQEGELELAADALAVQLAVQVGDGLEGVDRVDPGDAPHAADRVLPLDRHHRDRAIHVVLDPRGGDPHHPPMPAVPATYSTNQNVRIFRELFMREALPFRC